MERLFRKLARRFSLALCIAACVFGVASVGQSEDSSQNVAQARYGLAVMSGRMYQPASDIALNQLTGVAMFDYDAVWPHPAPAPLRFKVEVSMGMASVEREPRPFVSGNIVALYYLDRFVDRVIDTTLVRPYIEAGTGLIYADFRVEGQDWHKNFNPVLGFGADLFTDGGNEFFMGLRLHHISNAGLADENRGADTAMCVIGKYF